MENFENPLFAQLWKCLNDTSIEDIGISSLNGFTYFKQGRWHHKNAEGTPAELHDFAREIAYHIAETAGVTLSSRHPSLDTQLEQFQHLSSFRAHVVIPPLSGTGIHITLRRLGLEAIKLSLNDFGFTDCDIQKLRVAIQNRDSILIAGPTGSGKTSLLKALIDLCAKHERLAILEDSSEIAAPNALSFCLRSRLNRFESLEGSTWNLEQLVYESLRMRPDRIVLGECRGPEALGLLHAIQSGHRGVMCTIHASSPTQALERYQNLVQLAAKGYVQMKSAMWDLVVVLHLDQHHRRHGKVYENTQELA